VRKYHTEAEWREARRKAAREFWERNKANPLQDINPASIAKFWSLVDKAGPDDCWEWLGSRFKTGYGRFGFAHRQWYAHRVSMTLHDPSWDRRLLVCHTCDNPPCVNPAHLFCGTVADNMRDKSRKGRNRCNTPPGADHPNAKLTTEQARTILNSDKPASFFVERYGIHKTLVSNIRRRVSWRHL